MHLKSIAALTEIVTSPFASEDLAGEVPMVVMDLDALDESIRRDDGDVVIVEGLGALPAVTVGTLTRPPDPRVSSIIDAFDIVLAVGVDARTTVPTTDLASSLDRLRGSIRASPEAAVTMVELTRLSHTVDVRAALVAESLAYATLQTGSTFQRWLAERAAQAEATGDQPDPAEPPPPEPPVVVDFARSTMRVTLNRPHRHNALNAAMRDRLVEALRVASVDRSVDGIVIGGAGRSFCSGGDLDEFGTVATASAGHRIRMTRSPAWWLHQLRNRCRTYVHGATIGAGIELSAFTANVVASPDTMIRLPEVALGLVPGAGGTVSITRRIGRQRTNWLAISGQEIDAATARLWGLVDRIDTVVPTPPAAPDSC